MFFDLYNGDILAMSNLPSIESPDLSNCQIFTTNNSLVETMRKSFEFWHKTYDDSPINISLVWKKATDSNFEIMKKIEETLGGNKNQNENIQMTQFLQFWSIAIKESNFEKAKVVMQEWQEFWKNTTDEQFKIYIEILDLLETYWKNIQAKAIE